MSSTSCPRTARIRLLSVLTFLLFLVTGCGSSFEETITPSGNGQNPGATANLKFNFVLARAVPASVTSFRFTGRDSSQQVTYGPQTFAKSSSVVFSVPVSTVVIRGELLVGSTVIGRFELSTENLQPGETREFNDPNFTDVDPTPSPTPGPSTNELTAQGLETLAVGRLSDYVAARDLFAQAVESIRPGTPPGDSDTAYFFRALTRVAALVAELPSDGQSDGFNDVGDFLDALGYATSPRTSYLDLQAPSTFGGATRGEDARLFLLGRVRAELEGAIEDLNKVSQSFNTVWNQPRVGGGTSLQVESDYGDVLAFRGSFRGTLATLLVAGSYDFGGDVASQLNDVARTIQSILAANANALQPTGTTLLPTAQSQFGLGLDDLVAAVEWIRNESDPQNDDLINIAETLEMDVDSFLAQAEEWSQALTNPTTVTSSGGLSSATLDLPHYFSNGFALRPALPPFTDNKASGLFPGAPFGDVYHGYTPGDPSDPNRDSNSNGIPDILEP